MYCPVNNSDRCESRCTTRCCRLYNFALALLAALIFAGIGLILGVNFAIDLAGSLPLLVTAVVIVFIIFIVTLITRGCCDRENDCE